MMRVLVINTKESHYHARVVELSARSIIWRDEIRVKLKNIGVVSAVLKQTPAKLENIR
jgi:hypothetical protein